MNSARPQLDELPRVQSYLVTRSDFWELLSAYIEAAISNMHFIAYFFMILAMVLNGQWITIPYPLAVFGYALLEERRPSRLFWDIMILYSLFIIYARFIVQMFFSNQPFLKSLEHYYVGLEPKDDGLTMSRYIIIEVLIVISCLIARQMENLMGIQKELENPSESIRDAMERYLKNISFQSKKTGL